MVFLISRVPTAGGELMYGPGGYPPGTGHNACQVSLCKRLSKSVHCITSIKIFSICFKKDETFSVNGSLQGSLRNMFDPLIRGAVSARDLGCAATQRVAGSEA